MFSTSNSFSFKFYLLSLFVWLVVSGWCSFVLRENYRWLVAGGWFTLKEKYCCLVVDKANKQSGPLPCSLGLSATSQQYFSLGTNQPPATSQQYSSLRTNQHQPSATSQPNRLHASTSMSPHSKHCFYKKHFIY
jgi:hypothetical protein